MSEVYVSAQSREGLTAQHHGQQPAAHSPCPSISDVNPWAGLGCYTLCLWQTGRSPPGIICRSLHCIPGFKSEPGSARGGTPPPGAHQLPCTQDREGSRSDFVLRRSKHAPSWTLLSLSGRRGGARDTPLKGRCVPMAVQGALHVLRHAVCTGVNRSHARPRRRPPPLRLPPHVVA